MEINKLLISVDGPNETKRTLTAIHEASHLVFTIVLGGSTWGSIGIPTSKGEPPESPYKLHEDRDGYVLCSHDCREANGLISLAGWAFEVTYGDAETAWHDYSDAEQIFAQNTLPHMKIVALKMLRKLELPIAAGANQILIRSRLNGVVTSPHREKVISEVQRNLCSNLKERGRQTVKALAAREHRMWSARFNQG